MCVHFIFSSVWVAEWPHIWKEPPTQCTMCSVCIFTVCNFSYFLFGFECWIRVLIAPNPGLCILFTFCLEQEHIEHIGYFYGSV